MNPGQFPGAGSSLHSDAGLDLDEYFGGDVKRTNSRKILTTIQGQEEARCFSVLQKISLAWSTVVLTDGPLIGISVFHVIFPRILARKDYAHEAHTFG